MKRIVFAALALGAATMATPAAAQQACSRELLDGIANDYVASLEEGLPFKMNLGEWVEYWQNLERSSMSAFFDKPREVKSHHTLADTTACRVFVEAVVSNEDGERTLATQLSNGFFGVSPIHNLVPEQPAAATGDAWAAAPAAPVDRAQLTAAADAYLETAGAGPKAGRQYVVDEVNGAVNVLTTLGADKRPTALTLFVRDGKVAGVRKLEG